MILDGIAFAYGILLVPLIEHFDTNRSVMSNGGSLMFGFYLLSSVAAGVFVNKFGCRKVCIMGCLIASFGIGLSEFSPNPLVFMIFYGVIGGYGIGTMYIPSMVVISQYFEKNVRTLSLKLKLAKYTKRLVSERIGNWNCR